MLTPPEQMMIGILGGGTLVGAIFSFIQFLINRKDKKRNATAILEKDISEMKKDLKALTNEMKENQKNLKYELNENREDAIVMMHDRIYQAFNHLKDLPEISVEDKCNIDYLWDRYNGRGGNHKAELMYQQICKIPVVTKYKKRDDENEKINI